MRISSKFSSSSIVIAIVMAAVLVGGQSWVRRAQEDIFIKRQKLNDGLEAVHQMRANLRGQVNRLKDIVLLNDQNSSDFKQEQQGFLDAINQFERGFGGNVEVAQIKNQFQSLKRISSKTLKPSDHPIEHLQADFSEINRFEADISRHLEKLLKDFLQKDGESRKELGRLKRIDQVVTYAALGLIILVLGAQYWLILMPVIRSIEKLQFGASELAQGNLNYRLNFNTGDEIEQLANEFDHMTDRLRESYVSLLDRSTEVIVTNQKLETEITERKVIELDLRESEALLRQQKLDLEAAIQELQHAQFQLIQSEKMSSLGQLVAGIAHEINNPVNFIHGNVVYVDRYVKDITELVEICQQKAPELVSEFEDERDLELSFIQQDLGKILSSMKIGTERIRQIVLSLKSFSRMDEAEFKPVNIHEGIDSTLMILQHRLEQRNLPAIQIVKDYDDLPCVECYAGQLNQVFMNIIANAIDALEDKHSTTNAHIKIRTSMIYSNWVEIAISDNGCGIPESARSRIFDPFFTTKPVGRGTGMGMSISYQIITQKHKGKLDYTSTLGEGTEFVIQIPIQQTIPIEA
ncbi:MAG: ATP-binding protein [Leptolyngbya sp. Prado105]|nr:ATP-binding protein [Leptolyngbya sp. Prado105]